MFNNFSFVISLFLPQSPYGSGSSSLDRSACLFVVDIAKDARCLVQSFLSRTLQGCTMVSSVFSSQTKQGMFNGWFIFFLAIASDAQWLVQSLLLELCEGCTLVQSLLHRHSQGCGMTGLVSSSRTMQVMHDGWFSVFITGIARDAQVLYI
ncbi:hypothetical protein CEXT_356121 [Caerostris extrusa]|uniref:Secreted protein n=1 Tax=Caerostris extrusa TaxID=172846 RepID=A0AAV4VUD8_CAEEX|nr:hypothetical protein CEXT_356121 [Caerostris extrusa]